MRHSCIGRKWLVGAVRSRVATNKKRPKLFSSGRLGSPPPELPNHDWIVGGASQPVNVTSVTQQFFGVTCERYRKYLGWK